MSNYAQRGRQRERQVADWLRERDWVVLKGTSFGVADLCALRQRVVSYGNSTTTSAEVWLIEVKSTAGGPYERFGKADRASMVAEAARAGAVAMLAWWPPRGKLRLIPSSEWPA